MFKRRGRKQDEAIDEVLDVDVEAAAPEEDGESADDTVAFDRSRGPFDASEVDSTEGRLDLGALLIQGQEGMELRLELDADQQNVNAVTAVLGDSAVQLQAFAAPKSGGIWAEIRDEIAQSIATAGGTAQEREGALGQELLTRMPSAGPDGRTVFAPARFAGIDGPRWFLRAVFSGPAAIDQSAAAPLEELTRSAVVVRGDAPMAPRELLPLRLPEQPTPAPEADAEAPAPKGRDLNPFERGPEITEVR